jgi:hypothetical protein
MLTIIQMMRKTLLLLLFVSCRGEPEQTNPETLTNKTWQPSDTLMPMISDTAVADTTSLVVPAVDYYQAKFEAQMAYQNFMLEKQTWEIKYYATGLEKYRAKANQYVDSLNQLGRKWLLFDSIYNPEKNTK